MWAVVKFYNDREPRIFGIQHASDCDCLLTMDGVNWVQLVTWTGFTGKDPMAAPYAAKHA